MGFGFNLGMIFIVFPAIVILLILLATTRKPIFGKAIIGIIVGVIGIVILSTITQSLTSKIDLTKSDYYGSYIVDRDFFPGQQADWQYNSFIFEIRKNDSIYFYHTDKSKILKIYKGIAETRDYGSGSARIAFKMDNPTHHITADNPTTYRSAWDFCMVLHSEKFNNVFFRKGDWNPITD